MSMIPPLGAQQPPTDEEQAAAALAAIEQQIQGLGQEPQQPMGPPGFLERLFTSGAGEPSFTPMGFGSGLLQGLAGGLASRGQKVAQKRQQVEALIEQQRQAKGQQQLKDLEARRAAALNELTAVRGEHRRLTAEQRQQELNSTVVTPEMVRSKPELAPLVGKQIPNSVIAGAAFRPPASEPLVLIVGPNGQPMFVPRGAAIGKAPPEPELKPKAPSASERDQLVGDIGTLKQVGDIRAAFNPKLVGPASGRLGSITQKAGVFKRPGESTLRSSLAGMRNQILKLRSGGAVSDGEASRLLEELPTPLDPSDVFLSKLDQFENTYRTIATTRREVLSGTGVDVSKIPDLPKAASSGAVVVIDPNGKPHYFKTQENADRFKQAAGIP